ncbi:MAG: TonB-dependent receptor [Bacteroidota bacterium]|nr:TonB-dependent receptor [Bacteroidota bacterium]
MKLNLILILFTVLQVSASVSAQNTRLDLKMQNATISQVFDEIERQSQVYFFYNKNQIDETRTISVDFRNKTIDDILKTMLSELSLTYEFAGKNVIIKPAILQNNGLQQQKTVSGNVTDSSGASLPGVSVVVKGTTSGVITDMYGKYSITNVPGNATLQFSFVGMKSQEIAIAGKTTLNVVLEDETIGIDEVVAIGYGTVKKSVLTGSVSSIKVDELQATPMTSIDQGLVGRAAGVMVTQTSGMPGAIASIRVRGTSSLQGGNEPLYVIDGFPIYNGSGFGNTGGGSRFSGLSTINPSDIESIEILKDASATAIYGTRAANGVVLIKTKSGKVGSDVISFDATYGVQQVVQNIELMNALEFAEMTNEARVNDGLSPFFSEADMQKVRQNPIGTDWQKEIFRSAPTQNYQLTFSGGDQKTIYSISANYSEQQGIIHNSDFKRYSSRINLERQMLTNFRVGSNFTMSKTLANAVQTDSGGTSGIISTALGFNPILPVYQDEATRKYTLVNNTGLPYANPVATAREITRENHAVRLLGNLFGEWEILPNLKAKVSFGADLFNTKFNSYIPSNIQESSGVANASISGGTTTNWLNENTLSWVKEIGQNHKIDLLGGVTFQRNHYEDFAASSKSFVNDVLTFNSLQAGSIYNQPSSSASDWSLMSYLARVNYNFKERYLFSFSGRVDGSSRFGANNKYAVFPSGSFAWRLIEEDFIKNTNIFSNLKTRISYGITGNQEIGLYNSLSTLGTTNYTFGRQLVSGFFPNKIPNPDLRWEKTSQFDVGLDVAFFDNRLRITTDYYHKKTTDLIYSVPVSFVSGFGSALKNIGSIENKGLELSVGSDVLTGALSWTTEFNISSNKSNVLDLGGVQYQDIGGGDDHLKTGAAHRLIVGEPIGLFYGYVYDGIFRNADELAAGPKSPTNWVGGRRYADLGGPAGVPDGIVDATNDRTVIGDPNPDFFGGMTNTLSYKGFELNLFLQYSYGNDVFNYKAMELLLPTGGQNVYKDLVDRWRPDNIDSKYPKATTNRSAVFSSLYIEDGSYLKVKTLTLAYVFPSLKNKHISNMKLYVSGQNLFTFTNYSGYDPEVSYRGASNLELGEDFGGYPQAKTFLLGISLNIK